MKPPAFLIFIVMLHWLCACSTADMQNDTSQQPPEKQTIKTPSEPVETQPLPPPASVAEVPLPQGFSRHETGNNNFAAYLRNLPLKTNDSILNLYDGRPVSNQQLHYAIVDMDVGTADLQQCADAVMRLRAEYLFAQRRFSAIHFNFTSGDMASYTRYAEGYRAVVEGNSVRWVKRAGADTSYQTFRRYMDLVFMYAGTASLSKEMQPVALADMQIGDVFIQGGFPGHAVIVADMAEHTETGKRIFLLAQSYMPAQEIHLLKNFNNNELSPWYSVDFGEKLFTPLWTFEAGDLKRFR